MSNPTVERANIKSSLYLMDVVSYIAQSMGDLEGESECSAKGAKCGKIWQGKDPGQNVPSYLNPSLKDLPAIFTGLPANPTQDDVENALLSDPTSNADLKVALAKLSTSSLSDKKKARAKAALYLMDVISYIAQSMGDLDGEADCSLADAQCSAIWMGADPYANVPGKIQPSGNTLKKLFALAKDQDPKNYQQVLEDQYLIDPNSNFDLRLALCSMDPETNYCPVIGGDTVEIPKGEKTKMAIPVQNIAYLPGTPKITIMLTEDAEDGKITYDPSTVAKSSDSIVVTFNVPADAKLGDRILLVATEDGRFTTAKPKAFKVVEPSTNGDKPPVIAVDPDHAAPGDTVALTLTAENVDLSTADEVQSGAFNMLVIKSNDGKKIVLKKAKVNEDAKVQEYNIEVHDAAGKVIATAPFSVKPGEWTTMEKAAYLLQKQLGAEFNVSIGYSGFTGSHKLSDAPRTDQAAFENRQHLSLGLELAPHIVGAPDSDAFVKSKAVDLKFNGHLNYGLMFGRDTQMLGTGLGTNLKLTIVPEFQPEIYGQFEHDQADFHNPSVWALYGPQVHQGFLLSRDASELLYEGHSNALTGGLAFNSEFQTGKLPWKLRLYGESYQDKFTWMQETQMNEFSGEDQAFRLGFLGTLGFSALSPKAPDFTAHISGIPWGTHEEPVWGPGVNSSMYHGLTGVGAEGKLAWSAVEKWQPYVLGGYSEVTMDNWDNGKMSEWHAGVGSTLPFMYTQLGVLVGGRNNITPYGEDSPFYMMVSGGPATSRDILGGRLNAFSVSLTYDQFRDSQGTGYNALGGFLNVKLGTLIFGVAPDKPKVKIDEPAPAKKAEPAKPKAKATTTKTEAGGKVDLDAAAGL
ncbi:hypothetical protein ACFL4J_01120 [Candidatus Margulisiibacteriota bacterium]